MAETTNRISLDIPAADQADIQAAIQTLQAKLLPHLLDLSAQDRRELPKMGDRTLAFVGRALDYAQTNPALCPAYLDVPEFARDLGSVNQLQGMLRPLQQINDMLDDTALAAGSDAYSAALAFYQAVKGAARSKVPGAAVIADDLSRQFPGRGASTPAPTPSPATAA